MEERRLWTAFPGGFIYPKMTFPFLSSKWLEFGYFSRNWDDLLDFDYHIELNLLDLNAQDSFIIDRTFGLE